MVTKGKHMPNRLIYSFTEPILPEVLHDLFAQTAWAKDRTLLDIQQMLDNTQLILGVWDDEHLIGFARVVTDDIYRAWIEDVVVDEKYRQQGVGSHIIEKLLKRLEHVELIILDCEESLVSFYERYKFQAKKGASMLLIQKKE